MTITHLSCPVPIARVGHTSRVFCALCIAFREAVLAPCSSNEKLQTLARTCRNSVLLAPSTSNEERSVPFDRALLLHGTKTDVAPMPGLSITSVRIESE